MHFSYEPIWSILTFMLRPNTPHPRTSWRSVLLMTSASLSTQVGAASGALAFPAIGPVGVVAVRQLVAAGVLLAVARPRVRELTRRQWQPVLALALVFLVMNLSLYTAVQHIGLGLAVTLEFLGPLSVALLASRAVHDLVAAVAAAAGVFLLVRPGTSSDVFGIGLALLAACCWAAYIMLNRTAGQRLPGVQAPALATAISAALYMPFLVVIVHSGRMTPTALLYALGAGVLASAVPYALDLIALRHVAPRVFGVFMSLHPVLAAVTGLIVLRQHLDLLQWLGILIIAGANAAVVASSRS